MLTRLITLGNINDVDLTEALEAKYGKGCLGSAHLVCTCDGKS